MVAFFAARSSNVNVRPFETPGPEKEYEEIPRGTLRGFPRERIPGFVYSQPTLNEKHLVLDLTIGCKAPGKICFG
jgi:hypothetical protein